MKTPFLKSGFVALLSLCSLSAQAETLGDVNTNWHLMGSDKVTVEVYDDPLVQGVSCYVSRAKSGGVAGTLGLAEDKSEASIACRQTGEIKVLGSLPKQGEALKEKLSVLFKTLHVVRLVDVKRHTLVYLTYSDKLVSGSAKNSVTAVAVQAQVPLPVR